MTDYSDLYQQAGQQYGVDPKLLAVQGQVESSGDPDAQGPLTPYGQASGIAQLIPATAKSLGVTDPTDPTQAIPAQAKLMAENIKKYGDVRGALMAYHGGTDQSNWGPKTKAYAEKILSQYDPQTVAGDSTPTAASLQVAQNSNDPLGDAIDAALKEKNLSGAGSSTSSDPLGDALDAQIAINDAKAKGPASSTSPSDSPSALADIAKSIPSAVVRGVGAIPQIPAYAGNMAAKTEGWLAEQAHDLFSTNKLTPEQRNKLENIEPFYTGDTLSDQLAKTGAGLIRGTSNLTPQQQQGLQGVEQNGVTLGNQLPQPQTMPGRIASGAIEGALSGPAAGAGAVGSALSGTGASIAHELYPNNPLATLAGGMLPAAGGHVVDALSGSPINANRAQLAQDAQASGIKIPGGLLSNNPIANKLYSFADRMGMTPENNNMANLTKAVSNTFGENTHELTRTALDNAKDNIGKMYENVAGATPYIHLNGNPLNSLANVEDSARQVLGDDTPEYNKISGQIDKIMNIASQNNGTIPSSTWKDLTNSKSPISRLAKSGGELGAHAGEIKSALYDALRQSASPDTVEELNNADKYYKNYQTVKNLTDPVTGEIRPGGISQAVNNTAKKFGRGGLDQLQKLGDIGKQFNLSPSSGTAENSLLAKVVSAIPNSLVGGGAALSAGGGALALGAGIPAAAATTLGTYGLGKVIGKTLSSDTYRNALLKRALQPQSSLDSMIRYGAPASISGNIQKNQ